MALRRSVWKRRKATPDQITSATPNGQAPDQNPYPLDSKQPTAKATTNPGPRRSNAYMDIMNPTAQIP